MSINHIIKELRSTPKRTEKESILKKHKDNQLLKTAFYLAHSQFIIFDTKKLVPSTVYDTDLLDLEQVFDELKKVYQRELTGYAARDFLTSLHSKLMCPDDQQLLEKIIEKKLDCGVQTTTINKIWPNLIYDPAYMRCSSYNVENLKNIKYPCYSQTKMDGMYNNIIIGNNIVFESRSGLAKDYDLGIDKVNKISSIFSGFVLNSEILVANDDGSFMNREEGNGYLNSDYVDPDRIRIIVWDCLTIQEFRDKKSNRPYKQRLQTLGYKIEFLEKLGIDTIKLIDTKICNTVDEVVAHFKEKTSCGEEGTVIKNIDGLWKDGTSKDQIKLKCVFECDLVIVELKEGEGKNKGRLGAFVCESSDGKLRVNIGGGFSDKQRKELYDRCEIGGIITAKANGILKKKDIFSLFLPVFCEKRPDKTEADDLERIEEQLDSFLGLLYTK